MFYVDFISEVTIIEIEIAIF